MNLEFSSSIKAPKRRFERVFYRQHLLRQPSWYWKAATRYSNRYVDKKGLLVTIMKFDAEQCKEHGNFRLVLRIEAVAKVAFHYNAGDFN